MSTPRKEHKKKPERQSLIHVTPVECADLIIESQTFKVGGGLYGTGVYFANTIEAAALKVKHHKDHNIKWTYLIADVYIGKYKTYTKQEAIAAHPIDTQGLISQGFNSIFGYKQPTGREIICLDPTRIKNIKYIYGQKPSKFFRIDRPRITLFYVTDIHHAPAVHDEQKVPKTDGPFGRGYYLFYTISEAKKIHPNAETFFACDAHLSDFYEIHDGETLQSQHIRNKGYRSFHGHKDHIHYYIFKDHHLVERFHFCGGNPWNKREE